MRLLQINSVYPNGSTGRICEQIHHAFLNANLGKSKIIYFGDGKNDDDNTYNCSSIVYKKYAALKSRITGEYGFVSKNSTKKAIAIIKAYAPDIIHLHNIHDHAVDLEQLFDCIKKTDAKLVWTFHDCWAFTGYCAHYSLVKCDKWLNNCNNCLVARRYSWLKDKSELLQSRKKELYGNLNFEIVTPSKWLAKETQKSFLKNNNISVIYNGVDRSVFKPTLSSFKSRHNLGNKKIILGVAYQWDKRKGFDVFLRLAKIIDNNYAIVLVGNIPKTCQNLPENVISISRTSNQRELAAIYSAADVFVNPTREEVFGLVNIEALACGTPVITYNSGGSPECINRTCGVVTPNENMGVLMRNITEICYGDRCSREDCIERAKSFDISNMNQHYLEKYVEIIQEKTI